MSTIRQATANDLAAIKTLVSETILRCVTADEDAHRSIVGDICTLLDAWAESPADTVHLVCECEGKIIGVVLISKYEKINLLFVHPAKQREGIGTSLLESALEVCRHAGRSNNVTLNASDHAVPFYRKYGFIPNGQAQDLPGGCTPLVIPL